MNENMILPSFNIFKRKFKWYEDKAFEQFCYFLFCVEFNQYENIFRYKNENRIETEPILFNDKYIWWQSKFFEVELEENKNDFINMIDIAKEKYPKLDVLIIYTNEEWGNGKKSLALKKIEQRAEEKNIKIEWKTKKFFDSSFVLLDNWGISKYFLFNEIYYTEDKLDTFLNEKKENYNKLISDFLVNNNLFEALNYTTNAFLENFFLVDMSKEDVLEFDLKINSLKDVLFGNSNFKDFDYEGLLKVLEKEHNSKYIFEFVQKRWEAIKLYYNNELDLCFRKMIDIFNEYIDNNDIPAWLKNDLLVDIRNLKITICEELDVIYDEKYKKIEQYLLKSQYYPYIDQLEAKLNSELLNQIIDTNARLPYKELNGYNIFGIFKNIVKMFSTACFFGSLTQMKKITKNLGNAYLTFLNIHNDINFYKELIRIKIYELDYENIREIKSNFSEPSDYINEDYVSNLYKMSDNYPNDSYRNKMKIILFLMYADYLLEKEFEKRKRELIVLINNWIDDSKADESIGNIIIEILQKYVERFDSNELVLIIVKFLESSKEKFYNLVSYLSIYDITYNNVTVENKRLLMNTLFKLIKSEKRSCVNLKEAIMHLYKESPELKEEINKFLETNNKLYYKENLFFDNSLKSSDEQLEYIKKLLKSIEERIELQNEDDLHVYFYLVTKTLIEGNEIKIPNEIVLELEIYIEIVLKCPNRTSFDKGTAIDLLQCLIVKKYTLKKDKWEKIIRNNFSKILIAKKNLFFPSDNKLSQSLNLLLFILGGYQSIELIDIISNCEVSNDVKVNKNAFLHLIIEWLKIEDTSIINEDSLRVLRQYALSNIMSDSVGFREDSWDILFLISKKEELKSIILKAKSSLKNEFYGVKIGILRNIIKLEDVEDIKDDINEIKEICLNDNHYMVRSIARDI